MNPLPPPVPGETDAEHMDNAVRKLFAVLTRAAPQVSRNQ